MALYWWTYQALLVVLTRDVCEGQCCVHRQPGKKKKVKDRRKLVTPRLASHMVAEDMHTERVLTQINNSPALHTRRSYFNLPGVCSIQLIRHTKWLKECSQSNHHTHTHAHTHSVSQMNTPLEAEISGVRVHLRSAVSRSFTAEAAGSTPPAAAEEPGEGEQP